MLSTMGKYIFVQCMLMAFSLTGWATDSGFGLLKSVYGPEDFLSVIEQSEARPEPIFGMVFINGDYDEARKSYLSDLEKEVGANYLFDGNGGFVGGGGGSGVQRGEHFESLDLVQMDSSFRDVESLSGYSRYKIDQTEVVNPKRLEIPLFNNVDGLDGKVSVLVSDFSDNESFLSSDPFVYFNEISKRSVSHMRWQMRDDAEKIEWRWTSEEPKSQRRFDPSWLEGVSGVETVAYLKHDSASGKFNVIISKPRWNRLGFLSQVAIIAHEALRVSQFSTSGLQPSAFSENVLQIATSAMVFCDFWSVDSYITRLLYFAGFYVGNDHKYLKNDKIKEVRQKIIEVCEPHQFRKKRWYDIF